MNSLEAVKGKALTLEATDQLMTKYLSSLDMKPKSKDSYRKAIKHFLQWLSFKGIVSPSREDILTYKAELLEKYTACTVSNYITAVRSLYTYLEAERISPNIARGIKGAKSQKGFRKEALTVEQAKLILKRIDRKTLEGLRNFAVINLLIHTGLRTIEVTRADVKDIRNEAGEALLYIQGKGRDSKDAFVVLTEATLKPIRKYLKARGRVKESEPLFISHSDRNAGSRLTTRTISRIAKESLLKAGLDDDRLTAHSFRHTAITFSLMGGATIQEAQALARHSNINTTLIYAHNIDRIAKAPERRVDSILNGAV